MNSSRKNKKHIKFYLILVLVIIALISSYALSQRNSHNYPVVKIISENEYGEPYRKSYGIITEFDEETVVITDYYVVEEVHSVKIYFDDDAYVRADVRKDAETQTALLVPDKTSAFENLKKYPLGDSSTLITGEKLFIPADDGSKTVGIMEKTLPYFAHYYSPTILTTFTNGVKDSGKPVLNYRNEVVGMLSYYQKDRIIIPINSIKNKYYHSYKKSVEPVKTPKGDIYTYSTIPIMISLENYQEKAPVDVSQIYSKNPNCYFGEISKIQFGIDNSIYVLDKQYRRIYKFDESYKFIKSERESGVDKNIIKKPVSFAVTKAGFVYLLEDISNSKIKIFNRELKLIKEIRLENNLPYFDIEAGDRRVFVLSKNQIIIYDEKLNYIKTIGGNGVRDTNFQNVTDLGVLEDDKLVALDQDGAEVKIFTKDGKFLRKFPIHAPVNNSLSTFRNDHIVVVDKSNSKIKLFDDDGNFVRLYQTDSNSSYGVPEGVIFDNKEYIHIYYSNQSMIKVFNESGSLINICSSFFDNDDLYPLYEPKKLAVTKDKIVMLDRDNRLHIFEKDTAKSEDDNRETGEPEIPVTEDEGEYTIVYPEDAEAFSETSKNEPTLVDLPLGYRYNISGVVSDETNNVIYLSETLKGIIYKYDIDNEELSEIMIKGQYIAYDFIPILSHFDGKNLYIIDKMNRRLIITDTKGVTYGIKEIQDGFAQIIDVTTVGDSVVESGYQNDNNIFTLTKKDDIFRIFEYSQDWKLISSTPFKLDVDPVIGYPQGLAVYENIIFIIDPSTNKIMSYDMNTRSISDEISVPEEVGISYINKPSDLVLIENELFILDSNNNRVLRYSINKSLSNNIASE